MPQHLLLVPSLSCPAECLYCFGPKGSGPVMRPETIDEIVAWQNRSGEAEPYFWKAEALDPNGYFMVAHIGLHYAHLRNWAAAREWFERSLRLEWDDNPIARNYLQICNARLMEGAAMVAPGAAQPAKRP